MLLPHLIKVHSIIVNPLNYRLVVSVKENRQSEGDCPASQLLVNDNSTGIGQIRLVNPVPEDRYLWNWPGSEPFYKQVIKIPSHINYLLKVW